MKPTTTKKCLFYVKIIVAACILWALAHNSQLQPELFYSLLDRPFWVLSIIALCYLMIFINAYRWYRLNSAQNIKLPLSRTILPTYMGVAFNNILPGSVGGDFIRLYFVLKKFPSQKSAATLSIFVDRINGLMGIILIACTLSPYYFDASRHNSTLFYLLTSCIAIFAISLFSFTALAFLISKKNGASNRLAKMLFHSSWSKSIIPLLEAIRVYRNSKLIIMESLIISMITQSVLLIISVILIKIMGLPMLTFPDLMIALVFGQIANLLPLTPGGIGVGETAFANVILVLNPGTTATYATVFFALRLLSTIAYIPGAIFGIFGFDLPHHNLRVKSLDAEEA